MFTTVKQRFTRNNNINEKTYWITSPTPFCASSRVVNFHDLILLKIRSD